MSRRDPFSDPFFQDPFRRMDQMMGSMFNDPFFGGSGMRMAGFPPAFGGNMLHGLPGMYQQQQAPSARGQEGVTIEELDDENRPRHGRRARGNEPVVEEPDDLHHQRTSRQTNQQAAGSRTHQQPRSGHMSLVPDSLFGGGFNGFGGMSGQNGGTSVFSYSSSSYSSGGPGGVTYSSSTTHRQGPGGVSETHHQSYDGRTGEETVRIARALGDKSRTITRTRDSSGREQAVDNLNNIDEEDARYFDQEWMSHAQRSLPAAGRRQASDSIANGHYLESGRGRSRYA